MMNTFKKILPFMTLACSLPAFAGSGEMQGSFEVTHDETVLGRPTCNAALKVYLQSGTVDPDCASAIDNYNKNYKPISAAPAVPITQAAPEPAAPAPKPLSYATSSDLLQDAPARTTITPTVIRHASFDWEAADETSAESLVGEDGSVQYPYGASRPIVACAPLHICIIKFQDDEHISNISIGDSVRWKAQASTAGKYPTLVIKPTAVNIKTNVAVMTDQGRIYYLTLVSYANRWVPLVSFYDPQKIVETVVQTENEKAKAAVAAAVKKDADTVAELPGDDLSKLDFGYVSTGPSSNIKPLRVFSSAGHTYIQMPDSLKYQDAPAIFSLINGEQQLVNYKTKGPYYIIDGVPEKMNLVLGAGSNAKTVLIQHTGS